MSADCERSVDAIYEVALFVSKVETAFARQLCAMTVAHSLASGRIDRGNGYG